MSLNLTWRSKALNDPPLEHPRDPNQESTWVGSLHFSEKNTLEATCLVKDFLPGPSLAVLTFLTSTTMFQIVSLFDMQDVYSPQSSTPE